MKRPEHILISGGTGFIGQHLVPMLLQAGHRLTIYGRDTALIERLYAGNVRACSQLDEIVEPVDTIINLAGASIGEGRWSHRRKAVLVASRVGTTERICEWAMRQTQPPKRLINGSAVGFYGIDAQEKWHTVCDEQSPPQAVFVSELCQQWEAAADAFKALGTAVVKLRFGIVLGQGGGILPQLLLPTRASVGRLGSGRQPLVWVHIADVLGVLAWLLNQDSWRSETYNVVAPARSRQLDFVHSINHIQNRKSHLAVPTWLMRCAMGEQGDLVLNGQFVAPKNLLTQGYGFQFTDLTAALRDLLNQPVV